MHLNLGKILFILTLFFVSILITRFLSKLFLSYFDNKIKKKKSDDPNYFDKLIQWETQRLRSNSGLSPLFNKVKKKKKKVEMSFKEIYLNSKLSPQEITEIENLFFKIEWGGSEKLLTFQKKFKEITDFKFSSEEIIYALQFIKNKDLIFIIPNYYPNINKIRDLILNILIIRHLNLFINNSDSSFASTFSIKKKVSLQILKKSFICFLLTAKDYKLEKIIDSITKNNYNLNDCDLETKCIRYLFNYSKTSILSYPELSYKILSESNLFKFITPLPIFNEKSKSNLQNAYKLLGLSSSPKNKDQLKKAYKSMVMKKHPDQMKRHNIPDCYKNIITSNFQQIQLAYDFLGKKV